MKNKVSILIPVYNVSNYIERCAHSVFSQTFQEIEYIFVDDCTPDDSIDKLKRIINQYPERKPSVQIISHDINRGLSAARETAFKAATGEYVLVMDSDDYVELNMIELLYNKAIETKADIVYSPYYSELKDKTIQEGFHFSDNKLELLKLAIIGHSSYWNKLILRQILVENEIKPLVGIDHGEDLAVIAKILYYSKKIVFIPIPFYHYVQYNVNSTTKKFKPKYIEDRLKLVADLEAFFSSKSDYSLFEPSIWLLKALRKAKLLQLTKGADTYMNLFPEINPHINQLDLPIKFKIILWIAAKRKKILLKFVCQ